MKPAEGGCNFVQIQMKFRHTKLKTTKQILLDSLLKEKEKLASGSEKTDRLFEKFIAKFYSAN